MNRREFVKQSVAIGAAVGGGLALSGRFGRPSQRAAAAAVLPLPLRPPGALAEEDFLATCVRCMRCVDACPNLALVPVRNGDGAGSPGTPSLHPRKAACMLCAKEDGDYLKCTAVCPTGALKRVRKDRAEILEKVRIGVAELDLDLCYSYNHWSCGACFRACPLAGEAMTVGMWERPTVHPDACVGCGCCERACIRYPHAIRVRRVEMPAGGNGARARSRLRDEP